MNDRRNGPIFRTALGLLPTAASDIQAGDTGLWEDSASGALKFRTTAGVDQLLSAGVVADPGASGAIPANVSGVVDLVTSGAQTRTLAAPSFVGQSLVLNGDTIVTSCTVTVAAAFDTSGHTHIAITAAGQNAELVACTIAGVKTWRLLANNGATLS